LSGSGKQRFCQRACILAAVGLPADFDPDTQFDRWFAGVDYQHAGLPTDEALQTAIKRVFDGVLAARGV
jgi:hypothetical protein